MQHSESAYGKYDVPGIADLKEEGCWKVLGIYHSTSLTARTLQLFIYC